MQKQLMLLAIGLLSLLAIPVRVDAHAFAVRAEPRVGSKVKKAPNEVWIWFSQPIEPALSSIKVFDSTGKQVDKRNTHLDRANHALLHVSLKLGLPAGSYKVMWHATSVDWHVTGGDFKFQLAP
jgi:methionine-rich copper-binding protein CopC